MKMSNNIFISRNQELEKLSKFLDLTLNNNSQIVFISGEAGTGKSALVSEFFRLSKDKNKDLIFIISECNSYIGQTEGFLPFKKIIELLLKGKTSDNNDKIQQQNRKKKITSISQKLFFELAPDLVGIFMPWAGLIVKAGSIAAQKYKWFHKKPLNENLKNGKIPKFYDFNKDNLFTQYSNFLSNLSKKFPLVIAIEDLQWADNYSLEFLFYIIREFKKEKILLIGTYRESDVLLRRNEDLHPLLRIINESKRYKGDIVINIDPPCEQLDNEIYSNKFVKEYINTRFIPNEFSYDLIQFISKQTQGNALFIVELFEYLVETKQIYISDNNIWKNASNINYSRLPSRVEGIIKNRIERISNQIKDILIAACVEGETFTFQVIEAVTKINEDELLKKLTDNLIKQHRLIKEDSYKYFDSRELFLFRFSHLFFQKYLYDSLSEFQRQLLHKQIGQSLEILYKGYEDEIATKLAWHFLNSLQFDKAFKYLILSADISLKACAYDEALLSYQKAEEILVKLHERDIYKEFNILLSEEHIFDAKVDRANQEKVINDMIEIARKIDDKFLLAIAYDRLSVFYIYTLRYKKAFQTSRYILNFFKNDFQNFPIASAYRTIGVVLRRMKHYKFALKYLNISLEILKNLNENLEYSRTLNSIGHTYLALNDKDRALSCYINALKKAKEINYLRGTAMILLSLLNFYIDEGDFSSATSISDESYETIKKVGEKRFELYYYYLMCKLYSFIDEEKSSYFKESALLLSSELGIEYNEIPKSLKG